MLLFDVRCHALPLRCTCNNDDNEAVIGGAEGAGRFSGEGNEEDWQQQES